MALDPMLFKQFHKPGSQTAVPAPRPANPPPEAPKEEEPKGPVTSIGPLADTIRALAEEKRQTVEARGYAAETTAEDSIEEIEDAVVEELEVQPQEIPEVESKEITVFEEPKAVEAAGPVFKDRLDLLDSLVKSELGISPYTIDVIRGHVKQIMMDLVTQPELDAILIDRDVHNVLAFIRHVKIDAVESREKAIVKKETKKAKDSKFRSFDLDLTALGNAISKGNGLPLSLEDLSKFK